MNSELIKLIQDELNVKQVEFVEGKGELMVEFDITLTPELIAEGEARELVRQIQMKRKESGCSLTDKIIVKMPRWPKEFESQIMKKTLASKLEQSDKLEIFRA
ncbi:hypothetical protein HY338_01840 [Candidatus Gottesmanbacteria bacterium]|nr:hypothetical protein [Candidatus Gottesmanbacteria bacterium]